MTAPREGDDPAAPIPVGLVFLPPTTSTAAIAWTALALVLAIVAHLI